MRADAAALTLLRTRHLELAALASPVVTLVTSVLIARAVGPAGRGEVVLVAAWAQLAGWAGGLSIDKALITARHSVDPLRRSVPVATGLSTLLTTGTIASLAATVLLATVIEGTAMRILLLLCVLGTVVFDARAATLLRAQRWPAYTLLRYGQPLVYLAGCLIVLGVVRLAPQHGAAIFIGALCASLWLPALLVGGAPRLRPSWPSRAQLRALLAYGGTYHLGLVLHLLNTRIDVLIMPLRFTDAQIGIYAVACSAGQVVALLGQVNLVRALAGRPDPTHRVDRTGFVLAAVVAVVAATSVGWLLPLVYGADFADAVTPARLLCLGGLLLFLMQGLNGQLAARDRPWSTVAVNGAGVVVFAALLIGADTLLELAIANVSSTAVSLFVAWRLSRSGRPVPREVDLCKSESTPALSCPDTPPASKPSLTGSSAGLPKAPRMTSR